MRREELRQPSPGRQTQQELGTRRPAAGQQGAVYGVTRYRSLRPPPKHGRTIEPLSSGAGGRPTGPPVRPVRPVRAHASTSQSPPPPPPDLQRPTGAWQPRRHTPHAAAAIRDPWRTVLRATAGRQPGPNASTFTGRRRRRRRRRRRPAGYSGGLYILNGRPTLNRRVHTLGQRRWRRRGAESIRWLKTA